MLLLYVAVGGALGSVCRYLMTGWLNSLLGRTFPYSTLLVNVFGCFLLGIVV
ncbi:MAG: CrcB family protein, partial [Alphaproteobacteria bacterium]|nr:CrcB family protein [Alphaproteobacteria bacterium]